MAGILDLLGYGQGGGGILGGLPSWLQNTGGPQTGWQQPVDNVGQPGALRPEWRALLAGDLGPYQGGGNAQLPPNAVPTAGVARNTLAQPADSGFGQQGDSGNPIAGLLGGLGNGISSLFGGMQANGAPQAPGQPQAAAAAGPGIMDRLTAGATNFTTGGNPLAGLLNSISGLTTGQRTDRTGIALQSQAATYKALRAAGLPDAVAQAASVNPEVLKTIAPQLYSKPDFGVIGTDQYGNPTHGFIDKTKGQVTPASAVMAGGAGGNPAIGGPGVPGAAMDLHGPEYLKTLDPAKAELVKRTAEGLSPFPSGFVMKTPFGQWLTQAVGQYEPGVDANTFAARGVMLKDASKTTPGSLGGQITFSGTAINHLKDVAKAAEGLDASNGLGIAPLGHLINNVRALTTAQAAKVSELNGATGHYGQEVTKFYAGSPGGEGERTRFMTSIGQAKTKDELIGAIQAERDLIPGRIAELRNRIESTMGASAPKLTKQLDQAERGLADIDATLARMRGIAPAAAPQSGTTIAMTAQDQQAIAWAAAHPTDPRAAAIKQRLGVQ